jgi:hypothetical protein
MLTPATAPQIISTHQLLHQRPRLQRHYVQVPKALLYDYGDLSDGAKLTYEALLSFDYVDCDSGAHKGIVYPSIETLSTIRQKSRSTIYSHLAELEQCSLIESLPGEGYRLYNVPEKAELTCEGQRFTRSTRDAGEPHRAREATVCGTSTPSEKGETQMSDTLTFQKSGQLLMEEEDSQETIHYPYSVAGEDATLVVGKLVKLRFDMHLARGFVQRYGAVRVDTQITNLCRELQRGVVIRSYPRWLYRAIERNYTWCTACSCPTGHTPKRKRSIDEALTLPNGEVVYTILESADAE